MALPDSAFEAAAAVFGEEQLANLTIAIGLMKAYNRISISFRATPTAARYGKPGITTQAPTQHRRRLS